jgi:HAD superfamily hydrolase (TIGR01509 family)
VWDRDSSTASVNTFKFEVMSVYTDITAVEAVVFDLDGVILDTEELWDEVREGLARERGGRWSDRAQADMMGMSSPEWSAYMHDVVGLAEPPEEINREVVGRMLDRYAAQLPLIDGAVEAVERLAARWPLGLASSSNRELIDRALDVSGLARHFRATVSSEEVPRGKPAPDVYLEAARRLAVDPRACAAVEDSANGIRSGHAAGMRVVAIPNAAFPPPDDVLGLAATVLPSIGELRPEAVAGSS